MRFCLLACALSLVLLLQACGHTADLTVKRAAESQANAAIQRKDYAAAARIYQTAAAKYNDPADYDVRADLLSSAALWHAWSGNDAEALRTLQECAGLRRTISSQVSVEACESEIQELRSRTGLYANVPRPANAARSSAPPPMAGGSASGGRGNNAQPGGDGCPSSLAHIEPRLPRCTANAKLMELRQMLLDIDVSFRADRAQGYSYQRIAVINSQAAIEFENAMKQNEQAMLEASAHAGTARARLAALRDSPPRCDAAQAGAFGMGENAYQAYVASYMAAIGNRAVAAVAACLARRSP
ncbi:hypothetical protein [Hydrogenophaga sp.]|uniref:hypothetical protein n=1 Tax=Hydrogenophaga sp. TaxID=1904254 RepID=UPI002612B0D2|nr:hypothetical protein [Hydrogenophaga sp.]MCW5655501.1 hypothetical protein [Hydrogenophaga sp.]